MSVSVRADFSESRAANWNDCRPNDINPPRIPTGWRRGCVSVQLRSCDPAAIPAQRSQSTLLSVSLMTAECGRRNGPCSSSTQFESPPPPPPPSNTRIPRRTRRRRSVGFSFRLGARSRSHLRTKDASKNQLLVPRPLPCFVFVRGGRTDDAKGHLKERPSLQPQKSNVIAAVSGRRARPPFQLFAVAA